MLTMHQLNRSRGAGLLAFAFCLLAAASGCQSTHSSTPSTRLASVIINDRSVAQIESATADVFQAQGYQAVRSGPDESVFEKPGTTMDNLKYGGWMQGKVWVRVKAYLRPLGSPGEMLLDCDVYLVNDHGDKRFEEEHKVSKAQRRPYQDLLDEVKKRVSQ